MSVSFQYPIVFDERTSDVGQFTADIDTALNNVLSYNWSIKILVAKRKQTNQIVTTCNLADTNWDTLRLNSEIRCLDGEISKLKNEQQVILNSMEEAIGRLQAQRKLVDDCERQIEGGDHGLRMAVEKWDADIEYLQLKRDVLVNNLET
ncbi:hypothetical protein Daus18300_012090 [Diaporthe australafricana]|uniref:Uncharacterized protein n=1 Tax=Diaporthe australafricana TaxID=127596 RepID=A0ABR3W452_9PEZI